MTCAWYHPKIWSAALSSHLNQIIQHDQRQRRYGQEGCVSSLPKQLAATSCCTNQLWYVLCDGQHASVAVGCRFQLRCLMETPLHVQQGQVITGQLRLSAHNRQSYDVFLDLTAPPLHPGQLPQKVLPSTPCAKEKKRLCLLASIQ